MYSVPAPSVSPSLLSSPPPSFCLSCLLCFLLSEIVFSFSIWHIGDARAAVMASATAPNGLVRACFEQKLGVSLGVYNTSMRDPVHEKHVGITEVHAGSPAEAAGLPVGGLLVEINGQDVRGMALDQVAQLAKARPLSVAVQVPSASHSVESLLAGLFSQLPLDRLSSAEKEQYRGDRCVQPRRQKRHY